MTVTHISDRELQLAYFRFRLLVSKARLNRDSQYGKPWLTEELQLPPRYLNPKNGPYFWFKVGSCMTYESNESAMKGRLRGNAQKPNLNAVEAYASFALTYPASTRRDMCSSEVSHSGATG
jgi:hypothetical protein